MNKQALHITVKLPLRAAALAVPTLSQWALWGLALALGVAAVRGAGHTVARLAVSGLVAAAALAPWDGQVLPMPLLSMDNPSGGTVELPDPNALHSMDYYNVYDITNATGQAQRILAIRLEPGYQLNQSTQDRCVQNQVLEPGAPCTAGVNYTGPR